MLSQGDRRTHGIDWADSDLAAMCRDVARALDPAAIMHDAGLSPDPWQEEVIRSDGVDELLLCSRQSGKSTVTAAKAIGKAIYAAPALVLVINPAQRQSTELVLKAKEIHAALPGAPKLVGDSVLKLEFENGSRILALPGSDATIRGYSAPDLVIIDEAARVEDALVAAVRPMLAVSQGSLIALTTPYGRRGWFYKAWTEGGDRWRRTKITANDCPRITPQFLDKERAELGEWLFRQEYLVEFMDTEDQMFSSHLIDRMANPEVKPLW